MFGLPGKKKRPFVPAGSPVKWLWPLMGSLALLTLIYVVAEPTIQNAIDKSERQIEAKAVGDYRGLQRLASYRDPWAMIQEKPTRGWGIGSFIHIHPIYAGPEFYPPGWEYPVAYEFTHSDYLQCLAEFGWASCLLLFGPFGVLAVGLWPHRPWESRFAKWPLFASLAIAAVATIDMTLT